MKKLIVIGLLFSSCFFAKAQSTNTNYILSAVGVSNTIWTSFRTNLPFVLSQYPAVSGISNILAGANIISPGFFPISNYWANGPTGVMDFSTNLDYGCATVIPLSISGIRYAGAFASNSLEGSFTVTNAGAGSNIDVYIPGVRADDGQRDHWVTNGQVTEFKIKLKYGMTNMTVTHYY